jgi:hypothetical protein
VAVPESDFSLTSDEADAIARLSGLETLREEARKGNRTAMLGNIEKLIQAELRALERMRASKNRDSERPVA